MERKTLRGATKQAGDDGRFEAIICTLGQVDHDGDVILPGAFRGAVAVPIVAAHDQSSVPLGKARIVERGDAAVAVGTFNLAIREAAEWHAALTFDLASPPAAGEWSFGFFVPAGGASRETRDGRSVRVLRELDVIEVSPVLRGAGIGTGTLCAGASCDGAKGKRSHGHCCDGCAAQEATDRAVHAYAKSLYPNAADPVQLMHDMEEEDEAIRAEAEAILRAFGEDRDLKAKGRQRVKLLPAPSWVEAVVAAAARELDILPPHVRMFRPVEWWQKADRTLPIEIGGVATPHYREVFVHSGMTRGETVNVAAHEVFHVAYPDAYEYEAEDYGHDFAARWRQGVAA